MPKWAVAAAIGCSVVLVCIGGCVATIVLIGINAETEDQQSARDATASAVEQAASANTVPANGAVDDRFVVLSVASRVIDANLDGTRFGWQLTLRSAAAKDMILEAVLEFRDASGTVIHSERAFPLTLPAGAEQIFEGEVQLDAEIAQRADEITAEVAAL